MENIKLCVLYVYIFPRKSDWRRSVIHVHSYVLPSHKSHSPYNAAWEFLVCDAIDMHNIKFVFPFGFRYPLLAFVVVVVAFSCIRSSSSSYLPSLSRVQTQLEWTWKPTYTHKRRAGARSLAKEKYSVCVCVCCMRMHSFGLRSVNKTLFKTCWGRSQKTPWAKTTMTTTTTMMLMMAKESHNIWTLLLLLSLLFISNCPFRFWNFSNPSFIGLYIYVYTFLWDSSITRRLNVWWVTCRSNYGERRYKWVHT